MYSAFMLAMSGMISGLEQGHRDIVAWKIDLWLRVLLCQFKGCRAFFKNRSTGAQGPYSTGFAERYDMIYDVCFPV